MSNEEVNNLKFELASLWNMIEENDEKIDHLIVGLNKLIIIMSLSCIGRFRNLNELG